MAKTLYLANDTSDYHGGSWAVCDVLRRAATDAGWTVITETLRNRVEVDRIAACDGVLVNGEGTLHRAKPRARHLMAVLREAQRQGKPSALCNASWFGMGAEFDDVLRGLDQLCVREALSAAELRERHGVNPQMHLDLSYQHPARAAVGIPRRGLLATDFYAAEFDCFAWPNGGPLQEVPTLDMRRCNWQETLDAVAGAQMLLTGRFHGLMAACRTRTRFAAYPGNTDKIAGVLAWFGRSTPLVREFRRLRTSAEALAADGAFYDDFFAWLDTVPPWRFPF
jgi:hypothetical protein